MSPLSASKFISAYLVFALASTPFACSEESDIFHAKKLMSAGKGLSFSAKRLKVVNGVSWIIHIVSGGDDFNVNNVTIFLHDSQNSPIFMGRINPEKSRLEGFESDYSVTIHESLLVNSHVIISLIDNMGNYSSRKIVLRDLLDDKSRDETGSK